MVATYVDDKQMSSVGYVEDVQKLDVTPPTDLPPRQCYEPTTVEEKALDFKINLKLDIFVTTLLSVGFMLCASG
jgi:hypothetical protein